MNYIKIAASLLILCAVLTGCAAAPKLGKADTTGFNANNASVLVDYNLTVNQEDELTADEVAELRNERLQEIHAMLQSHGFTPATDGIATFRMKISEGAAQDITGEWAGAVGVNAVLFTLGVVPAVFTYSSRINYELWAGQELIHSIETPAQWDEPFGLISISSTLSGADAAKYKARTEAHDSVIRLWIEQGSFE
ncbi:MAG: hypothetical protein R3241_05045 [Rheinheimera sp.]|nr:hypothetical protein [Rheinheimera sp.]